MYLVLVFSKMCGSDLTCFNPTHRALNCQVEINSCMSLVIKMGHSGCDAYP